MTFEELGIKIENPKPGNNLTTCPRCSHDRKKTDQKCLSVDVDRGLYNCHHCGFGGKLTDEANAANDAIMYGWFASRKISPKTVREANITFDGKWIKFPYTRHWREVNYKLRKLESKDFSQMKDGQKSLFGLDEVRAGCPFLVIVEGEMDVLALRECGFYDVVSVPDGAPNPGSREGAKLQVFDDPEIEAWLNKIDNVVIAVDEDGPGAQLRDALVRRIGYEKCRIVSWVDQETGENAKDANEFLIKYGKDRTASRINGAKEVPVEGIYYAKDVLEDMYREYVNGTEKGKSTGITALDHLWTVRTREFSVVHGYPSSGKSKFVLRVAVNMAKLHGMKFVIFPAENLPVSRFYNEIVEFYLEKPLRDFQGNVVPLKEFEEGFVFAHKHFSVVLPEESPTLDSLLSRSLVQIRRWGADCVILDPWTEILAVQERNENKSDYIERALSKAIRFTKTNNIHFLVVAHPAKPRDLTPSNRPPHASEISGSMMWYNKPDNIICVHRPDRQKSEVDIITQKIRFREVGEHGIEKMRYDKWSGLYIPQVLAEYEESKRKEKGYGRESKSSY